MKRRMYNTLYFLKEAWTLFRTNLLSNLFSFLSTTLIFFILGLVLTGGWISNQIVEALQNEAAISVYFNEDLSENALLKEVEVLKQLSGVKEASYIDEATAYTRMEAILGNDAKVLSYFDENPFGAFVELSIDLDQLDPIMARLNEIPEISHIRDNREILDKLHQVAQILTMLGIVVILAVGISTFVIVAHMIRQGIYQNKEQINTMVLLGAPSLFRSIPFVIEGFLLTIFGGGIAIALVAFAVTKLYEQLAGPLPFIPLPSKAEVLRSISLIMVTLSAVLGLLGSIFGLSSTKEKH